MLRTDARSTVAIGSRPLDEAVDDLLLAGLVEGDGQLVAIDPDHFAIAELLVKHAVAEREFGGCSGGLRDQLALDRQRPAFVAAEWTAEAAAERIAPRERRWLLLEAALRSAS